MVDVTEFRSRAARDAAASGYGDESYWTYLDRAAAEHFIYFMERGMPERAEAEFTRSLGEALIGNDGI